MTPVLQVDKEEWEAFLSEFSKLAKNCELIVSKLEEAQAQIRMLNEQNEALRREARGMVGFPTGQGAAEPVESELEEIRQGEPIRKFSEPEPAGKLKRGFLESVRFRLSRLPRGQRDSYVYCRRCGYQIKKASRFCSGCGVDFGAFICLCGRDVSRGDRFCDRCGRKVDLL